MSSTTASTAKKVVTAEEFVNLMNDAKKQGRKEIFLSDAEFEDVRLRCVDIPVSLDLRNCVFRGHFALIQCKFYGSFIELSGSTIHKNLTLNGLEALGRSVGGTGYGLYLRDTKIFGDVSLCGTNIDWLCVGGLKFYTRNGRKNFNPIIRTGGSKIENISLALSEHI